MLKIDFAYVNINKANYNIECSNKTMLPVDNSNSHAKIFVLEFMNSKYGTIYDILIQYI